MSYLITFTNGTHSQAQNLAEVEKVVLEGGSLVADVFKVERVNFKRVEKVVFNSKTKEK